MERYLREWRDGAAANNAYDTAIFVGDKVLDLTESDKDAIRLAQLYFSAGKFYNAHFVLERRNLINGSSECQLLAAKALIKLNKFDNALDVLGEKAPSNLVQRKGHTRRKLNHADNGSRPVSATHGRQNSASNMNNNSKVNENDREEEQERRNQAAMSYLRGLCYAKGNAFDRAKQCYKEAVQIDVQCFEAFDQLIKNSLLEPSEEWEFLESLDFESIPKANDPTSMRQQAADLTKKLYITRLSKYKNTNELNSTIENLSTHYNLLSNPDLLLSKAELLFTQCRFREALNLTDRVLERDRYNFSALPVHLACLHELNEKNALFLLAHDFADNHPEDPATWLAVGVYYLSIGSIAAARRFFSKSSMMDPHFGPAWIGFAHTFAAEGEHDQASSAYATAARLFQGTHLPLLFLGMQNLQLQHLSFARDYLNAAYALCLTDPLLLNEMGVVSYHSDRLDACLSLFGKSLELAINAGAEPRAWIATRINLGHTLRRLENWEEALNQFDEVLKYQGQDVAVFAAKAICLLELGRSFEAIAVLNEALAVSPQDTMANDLMSRALEERLGAASLLDFEEDESGMPNVAEATVGLYAHGKNVTQTSQADFEDILQALKSDVETKAERERDLGRPARRSSSFANSSKMKGKEKVSNNTAGSRPPDVRM